jgi:hypothetical protein
MLTDTLKTLFDRDLTRLMEELELYKNEENIWIVEKNITNSAGNLALHLIGNLNTFIGAQIGKTSYVRNRPLEFSQKNIPRDVLIKDIRETMIVIEHALSGISSSDMDEIYPLLVFDQWTSTEYLLVHLTTHLSYHLGQVNYHRRMMDR